VPLDDRKSKKMFVFTSPRNPLWQTLFGSTNVPQNAINEVVGISATTLSNWKRGLPIGSRAERDVFSKTIARIDNSQLDASLRSALAQAVEKFRTIYFQQNTHLYVAAACLTMGIESCRIVMDEIYYEHRPVFYRMYYTNERDSLETADNHMNLYRGCYRIFLHRDDTWLRCSLHVRHLIRIGAGQAIRCKLNIPKIGAVMGEIPYYRYDGFLVRRPHKVFWMFEKRDSDMNDYFFMITGIGRRPDGVFTMGGAYLTTGQDEHQSVVTGDILLQLIERDDAKIEEVMPKEPSPTVTENIADQIIQLRTRYDSSSF